MLKLVGVVLISIFLCLLLACSLSARKSLSPKAFPIGANYEKYRHLWDKPAKPLKPITIIESLDNLPVYIKHPAESNSPDTYVGVLWGAHPMGQYLYYLAGDMSKTSDGHLNLNDKEFTTLSLVETSFEDDVIRVYLHDGIEAQKRADENPITEGKLQNGKWHKIEDLFNSYTDNGYFRAGDASLNDIFSDDIPGVSRLEFYRSNRGYKIDLIYNYLREPKKTSEFRRLLTVRVEHSSKEPNFRALVAHFETIVHEYGNMPYVPVSGSVRM
ncbi:hypothetical protein [Microbulbifer sp. TRSA005]|uniref:hypothetical protein n=1 Tax=Microbulbifer sp. TRSA005 TaxID=3243383 RepID=UPI004039D41C